MSETREQQKFRHKALDGQWAHARALLANVMSLQTHIDIAGDLDPKTNSKLRHAEELIADIREAHPQ